jgi:hypothetical protein
VEHCTGIRSDFGKSMLSFCTKVVFLSKLIASAERKPICTQLVFLKEDYSQVDDAKRVKMLTISIIRLAPRAASSMRLPMELKKSKASLAGPWKMVRPSASRVSRSNSL